MASDGSLVFDTKISLDDFLKAIKDIQSKSDEASNKMSSKWKTAFSKAGSFAKTAAKSIGVALGAISAGLGAGVKMGVEYNAQMEQFFTSFETMLGSTEAATKMMADLKKFAADTPFEMPDIAKGTQTLLAFGIEGDKVMDTIKMLGDVSLGNKDRFDSLTLAFAQMSSTGKLMGQDLLQMINAGFNPLNEMSKMTGKSIGQLKEEMAAGAISAEMVTEAFQHATQEGGQFFNAMEAQSKTLSGSWDNLKDDFRSLLGDITAGLTNSIKGKAIPMLRSWMTQLQDAFNKGGLAGLTKKIGDVLSQAVKEVVNFMPKIIKTGTDVLKGFLEGIQKNAGDIVKAATSVISSFVDAVVDLLPLIIDVGLEILFNLVEGIAKELPYLIPKVVEMFFDILTNLLTDIPRMLELGVAIIGGILEGIVMAIPKLIEGIGKAFASIFNGRALGIQEAIDAELAESTASVDALFGAMQQSAQNHKDTLAEIYADADSASLMAEELAKLTEQESLSAAEKERMIALVSNLNALYPELNLQFDEENGTLNLTNDQLRDYIENSKEAGLAAAYRARMAATAEERIDLLLEESRLIKKIGVAEKEVADKKAFKLHVDEVYDALNAGAGAFQTHRAELEALGIEYDEAGNPVMSYNEALDFLLTKQTAADDALTVSQGVLDGLGIKLRDTKSAVTELDIEEMNLTTLLKDNTAATQENTDAVQASGDAATEAAGKKTDANDAVVASNDEVASSNDKVASSSTGAATAVEGSAKKEAAAVGTATQSMTRDLNTQEQATKDWATNVTALGSKLSGDFSRELKALGPEAADAIAMMTRMSDTELDKLQKAFDKGGMDAVNDLITQMKNPATATAASGMVDKSAGAIKSNTGITDSIYLAMEQAYKTVVAYQTKFLYLGKNLASGIAEGIRQGSTVITNAAKSAVNKALNAAKAAAGVHSPSTVWRDELGKMMAAGTGIGFEQEMPKQFDKMTRVMMAEQNDLFKTASVDVKGIIPDTPISVQGGDTSGIMSILSRYLPMLEKFQLVLDTGELVGAIAPSMDEELGEIAVRREKYA
ncbi:MAG: tape measure protein [Christensenellaceae bacterium]|jgi:tape measure domain-containing protein